MKIILGTQSTHIFIRFNRGFSPIGEGGLTGQREALVSFGVGYMPKSLRTESSERISRTSAVAIAILGMSYFVVRSLI